MKVYKNLGFTLVKLLVIIIILAIASLVAILITFGLAENNNISKGKANAQLILDEINNYCATEDAKNQLDNGYTKICTLDMDKNDVLTIISIENVDIISIKYNGTKLTELVIRSNEHNFKLCRSGQFVMDNEECDAAEVLTTGPIKDVVLSNFPYLETNGNGCIIPNNDNYSYMGGCYIKGNSNNNYIWYSGFLWRIMGINADGTIRLITEENVTAISWGESDIVGNWDESYAKDWLNNYFYSRLKGNNIIKEKIWCSEVTIDYNSARTICENNLSTQPAYVGLITLDEYNLASSGSSYLSNLQRVWTMTLFDKFAAWGGYTGSSSDPYSATSGLRAVINVNSDAIITGGNGTLGATWSSQAGPYILNEDKNVEITGKLNEKATSGEYVMFAGRKYRVVDKDSNGNTKLILDEYYEENGSIFEMKYNNTRTALFSTETGIGQKLNTDVLNWLTNNNDVEKGKLVTNYIWYQNNFASGQNYTVSLNEKNPTKSVEAAVGLIRMGEILSSQSSSILTNEYTTSSHWANAHSYWGMTLGPTISSAWIVDSSGKSGYFDDYLMSNPESALRPVIVIKSDVSITGGNGIWSNPYQI